VSVGDFASEESLVRDERLFLAPRTAEVLNARFVPIKVDRHQRPEIAAAWASSSMASDGSTIVLTPEGFPVRDLTRDEAEEPSVFVDRLLRMANDYAKEPARFDLQARSGLPAQRPAVGVMKGAAPDAALAEGRLRRIVDAFPRSGEVASAPSLSAGTLRLLLRRQARCPQPELALIAAAYLEGVARSDRRDPLAGGFHAERRGGGAPPPLEKVLCHNALLLRSLSEGAAASKDLLLRNTAHETAAWMLREMRDAAGYFWSSVASGQTNGYYLWTREEIVRWLGPERGGEFLGVYAIEPPGLLVLRGSPFAGLGSSRDVLLNRRARRVRPPVNDEVLTSWNGLAIGALAREGFLLERGSDVAAARRAAEALLECVGPARSLKRSCRGGRAQGAAVLEDYAYLAEGLLDLGEATRDARWSAEARALVDAAAVRLWDAADGGFFETDDPHLVVRLKRGADTDLPSANAVMVSVLIRLARLTGDARYTSLAAKTVAAFAGDLQQGTPAYDTLIENVLESSAPRVSADYGELDGRQFPRCNTRTRAQCTRCRQRASELGSTACASGGRLDPIGTKSSSSRL
jgi:uncharacterized protein YyaL (SSP411 family)